MRLASEATTQRFGREAAKNATEKKLVSQHMSNVQLVGGFNPSEKY